MVQPYPRHTKNQGSLAKSSHYQELTPFLTTLLEDVQNLANHADSRTTRLYDRRRRTVSRNIVERIPNYVELE